MARVEHTERTIYTFDELSDDAKERARDWWRELEAQDFESDYIFEDAERVAKILGIDIEQNPVKLYGGGTSYKPTIYYSGFCSQGDGACFVGHYSYAKDSRKAIREYAPQDETLHRIADDLFDVQRKNFYRIEARAKHRGHYYHTGCMSIDVYNEHAPDANAQDAIAQSLRDFADWIYKTLEAEYNYRMSDESVDESIKCNEYEFTEDGARA